MDFGIGCQRRDLVLEPKWLPTYLPTYRPTDLPTYLPNFLLPTFLLTYLPTSSSSAGVSRVVVMVVVVVVLWLWCCCRLLDFAHLLSKLSVERCGAAPHLEVRLTLLGLMPLPLPK